MIAIAVTPCLTAREREILQLVCSGLSNKEIGRKLCLSDGTIKVHLHHVYEKLAVRNRTALAALALGATDVARVDPEARFSSAK